MKNFPHQELTKSIIGIYYNVYNELDFGFLEKVYHKSFLIELKRNGVKLILRKKQMSIIKMKSLEHIFQI